MKFQDQIRVRRAFLDAMSDTSVRNGINDNGLYRRIFQAALLTPFFYKEIDKVLEEEGMSVDAFIESIPEEWEKGFNFNIPS